MIKKFGISSVPFFCDGSVHDVLRSGKVNYWTGPGRYLNKSSPITSVLIMQLPSRTVLCY